MDDRPQEGFRLHYLRSVSDEAESTGGFSSMAEVRAYVKAENMSASCDEAYASGPDGRIVEGDLLVEATA